MVKPKNGTTAGITQPAAQPRMTVTQASDNGLVGETVDTDFIDRMQPGDRVVIDSGMSQADALEDMREKIRYLNEEASVLVDENGFIYLSKGDGHSVLPAYSMLPDAILADTSKVYALHNHPLDGRRTFGGPFSDADINSFFRRGNSLYTVTAAEGDYTFRMTDTSKEAKARAFFNNVKQGRYPWQRTRKKSNYYKNSEKAWLAGIDNGTYTSDTDGFLRASYDTLGKFGKRYGFEVQFKPRQGYTDLFGNPYENPITGAKLDAPLRKRR